MWRQMRGTHRGHLRPPGAGREADFLSRCVRCTQCIEACPTDVLKPAGVDSGLSLGTPYLNPRTTPCDLCQGQEVMQCIAVCPTRALQPLARRSDVRMGVAVLDVNTCLPFLGIACKACWHACPFPGDAITFNPRGRPVVVDDACVGCGLCEYACLTEPSSIRIVPHAHEL